MVDEILDAAGDVLKSNHADTFNTRQIARVAGISVGSVYQYFSNKREILAALQDRLTTRVVESLKQLLPELSGHELEYVVRIVLNDICDILDENDGRYMALVQQWQHSDMRDSIHRIESMVFATVGLLASVHPELRRVDNLPLTLYIGINSVIFNLVRYSSEPSQYFSRETLVDGLAAMFSSYVQNQARTVPG